MRISSHSLVVAVAALAACGGNGAPPTSPTPPGMDVGPSLVESVDVRIAESFPVQVFSRITGVVGDGCSTLLPIEQTRSGTEITVEVRRERPKGAICTQIARLFDETIRLTGEFPPGTYRLKVNDVVHPFVVD